MGIISPDLCTTAERASTVVNKWNIKTIESDLPVVRANGSNNALALANRNFRNELA